MKDKVYELNKKFYDALNKSDLADMERIWANSSSSKCVHPGWPMLKGWESIRDSWRDIFESGGFNKVVISDVFVDVIGRAAWVNCIEKIDYLIDDRLIVTMAQSTNVFELIDGEWKMVLHHASPMPAPRSEAKDHTLQ